MEDRGGQSRLARWQAASIQAHHQRRIRGSDAVSTTQNHAQVRWFAEIGLADEPRVGAKAAGLGELQRAGIRVPPGFVVTTSAFERALDALDRAELFRPRISCLALDDIDGIARVCREIRQQIDGTPLPVDLHAAIADAYRALSLNPAARGAQREADLPVAVRSSVTSQSAEGTDASSDSPHDTFLWVRGTEGVLHAVRSCWASLYRVESVTHRLRRNLPESHVSMGVVVQRMVNSQCSGVMFTRCLATGDHSLITIEGCWGLGSGIVSGDLKPDRFVVSKVTGEIVKRVIAEKRMQHLPDHFGGGVRDEAVPADHQKAPCLTDAQIAELAQLARLVERRFGAPQDIEWAIDRDERDPVLLQCRSETTPALPAPGSGARVVPLSAKRT
jgi:pyruvate, water dikinase